MGFGAMRLTGPGIWGEPKDAVEARRVLRRAVELGVDFIDTADAYGPEVSERLIKEALHPYPAGLVIATKGGSLRPGPDQWAQDGSPAHLREACEASLRRLKLERIDLYQLHRIDAKVPVADSLGELARLQKEGKIRHIGVSQVSVDELATVRRIVPIVSVQNRYNAADRSSAAVLAVCERERLAFIPLGADRARFRGQARGQQRSRARAGSGCARSECAAGGARMAAGEIARHAAHTRHFLGDAPGGGHCRRARQANCRGACRARLAPGSSKEYPDRASDWLNISAIEIVRRQYLPGTGRNRPSSAGGRSKLPATKRTFASSALSKEMSVEPKLSIGISSTSNSRRSR
jgi:aryl-alcohol dehydrogenase-like predicted oxidoreductase